MKTILLTGLLACIALADTVFSASPADRLNVVTSLEDLASIAEEIGGDRIEVFAIAKGYQDPHFVDAKPSYMIKLQKADMFVEVGLDLEIGWVPPLLEGARNPNILPGARGYVDASKGIPLLEIPQGDPTKLRAQGDIHVYGNPHYWLDPQRGKVIADNIFAGLARLRPEDSQYFQTNLDNFKKKIDEKTAEWLKRLEPYWGIKISAFHNSWPYFSERFKIDVIDFIEPKPGIPPTPKDLIRVIKAMQEQNAKIIIIEPYYSKKSAELIAEKVGGVLLELGTSVDAEPEIKNYFALFDYNIDKLLAAITQTKSTSH